MKTINSNAAPACGLGRSRVTFWAKERLKLPRTHTSESPPIRTREHRSDAYIYYQNIQRLRLQRSERASDIVFHALMAGKGLENVILHAFYCVSRNVINIVTLHRNNLFPQTPRTLKVLYKRTLAGWTHFVCA